MKPKRLTLAVLVALSLAGPAVAQDSVERGSAASLAASQVSAATAAWIAHEGSELTVKAVHASAEGVVLTLAAAGSAIEVSATVAGEVLSAAGVAVGTSVRVVVEATGYALMAAGALLAYVPNEAGRALLYHARH